jgi:hypothetical protein
MYRNERNERREFVTKIKKGAPRKSEKALEREEP